VRWVLALLGIFALVAPSASARVAEKPWPPAAGPGQLFIHFGEEHIRDEDGPTLLPKIAGEAARYKPALVTTSGDKATDGVEEQFADWDKAMKVLDDAGVPILAGVGNHDRTSPLPPGLEGTAGLFELTTSDSFNVYRAHFAKRPYPWGDGAPYPSIGPVQRPGDDPTGAAAIYSADVGNVRWIFLDNSCWSLSACDNFQLRADARTDSQLSFLRAEATEATQQGKVAFVVMHIPTQDPRDQSYTDTTAQNHIMGKGISPRSADNGAFEQVAQESGVDGVFVGHIKGQFLYRGRGDIPYFIDGGAGGELYTTGPVGTDHGYWHGFRLVRVDGGKLTTDTVPIFVDDGITIEGPDTVERGKVASFQGFGRQPVFKDPAKVERLELRDPAPKARADGRRLAGWLIWLLPLGITGLFAVVAAKARLLQRGPRTALAALTGYVVISGAGAVAIAQQERPTSTPKEALPTPARIWTSSNPRVLAPQPVANDDARRNPATQTTGGTFEARCPGRAWLSLTSGFEETTKAVTVPSRSGRLLRSVALGTRVIKRGRRAYVATVRPAQPVVIHAVVKRGKRVVGTLLNRCTSQPQRLLLDTRGAAPGRYSVSIAVRSDRKPQYRRFAIRVTR